jgi:hypothetical protein
MRYLGIHWMISKLFQNHDGHRMCFCEEDGCNLNGSEMLKSVPFNMLAITCISIFYMI